QSGGPGWSVLLGRLDGFTSNFFEAGKLPSPFDGLKNLKEKFRNATLDDTTDLVALSGNQPSSRTCTTHVRRENIGLDSVSTVSLPRRAHFRPRAMPVRHGPAVQLQRDEPARPDPQPGLQDLPVPAMPKERRRVVPERPRPDHTRQVRQELLHE
uniref:Plant heme peroxidase family profile domain-containing protein n=1 Tax=Aegilops tauschii subsp. strangulata TaxID=200361 RepID=A0A452XZU5_AEGTS